jgi:two-component system, OmpR family, sensor kinase
VTGRRRLSLRATLLLGYALGLTAVVAVFSLVAQALYWRTLVTGLDTELTARAASLAAGVRMGPDGHFDIDPPDTLLAFLDARRDGFFAVWSADGRVIDLTAPDVAVPAVAPGARTRGDRREVALAGPYGTMLVVGRSLSVERDQYGEFIAALGMAGLSAVAIAFGSGWLFVRRALAPIDRIGRTAAAMSSADTLTRRIDVGDTESELGRIATALNGAFDRLQAVVDRQARFTADASHELRTPLSTVVSECEWALRRERSPADYRRAFETCLRAAGRMRAVVEGLLSLARADAGDPRFGREPVDLAAVVRDVLQMADGAARARGLVVSSQLEAAVVTGDPERLREVVQNLVQNAVQYNRPGGRVHVSTAQHNGTVTLDVRDTGIGVPASMIPHVFERFYRGDAARAAGTGGSGLGLAIAKWIAETHGGTIRCTSGLEEGTTFRVELPAMADEPCAASRPS